MGRVAKAGDVSYWTLGGFCGATRPLEPTEPLGGNALVQLARPKNKKRVQNNAGCSARCEGHEGN